MTPKEKAKELLNSYSVFEWSENGYKLDKKISLDICVSICQEVLLVLNEIDNTDENTLAYNYSVFYNKTITELKKSYESISS
jgi:hypothetical protein